MRLARRGLAGIALVAATGCFGPFGRKPQPTPARPLPADSVLTPPAPLDSVQLPKTPNPSPLVNEVAKAKAPERMGEQCLLDVENTGDTRMIAVKDPTTGKYSSFWGGGVLAICRSQGIRITADSAESYEGAGLYYLFGNVKYREKRVSLDSDKLTYFKKDERVLVEGNVIAVTDDSSRMVGPRAEYLRAVRGIRPQSRLVADSRPTLSFFETDSLGKRQKDPVTVIANSIIGVGDTLFSAFGKVELNRVDLIARGDSAMLNKMQQTSRLMKQPYVESKGSQPFTLRGKTIDVFGRSRQIERIVALDSAQAVSKDLTLRSDTLDLRVTANLLTRAFAFGGRAVAITKERRIDADSLDVRLPDQRIRELHAVGNAYAETDADTIKITSTQRDWIRGDTIVALFDSLAKGDTASAPPAKELLASGTASSFYQLPDNKGRKEKPGLNYVRGRQIRVDFKDREVKSVTVIDQATGLFLEAKPDSAATVPAKGKAKRPAAPPRRPPTQRPE